MKIAVAGTGYVGLSMAILLAQKNKVDSMYQLLAREKVDTNRVKLMWEIGYETRGYDPEKALVITILTSDSKIFIDHF